MKIKTALALFAGLFVGLVVGLVVGAVAAWMLAAHRPPPCFTSQPFPRAMSQLPQWHSSEPAAPDSVEEQLRSQGKHWVRIAGEITAGDYVQDIFEGRLGQPKGRGAIGKVVSLIVGNNGGPVAMVDFGRNYSVGINVTELSLVSVVREDK